MRRSAGSKRTLVLGATSAIARSIALELAARGSHIHLAGRDADEVLRLALDVRIRCAASPVTATRLDATDYASHGAFLDQAILALGGLDTVVVAIGELGTQRTQTDPAAARRVLETNLVAVVSLLTPLAERLREQGRGRIVVISSVAGDRGRASNYVYGASKAGLNVFLEGLGAHLFRSGVHVLNVKPGLVDTKMIFGQKGGILAWPPEKVASDVMKALDRGANVVYTPGFWRWIMLLVRSLPSVVMKRLRF